MVEDSARGEPGPAEVGVLVEAVAVEDQQLAGVWARLVGDLGKVVQPEEVVLAQRFRKRALERERDSSPRSPGLPQQPGQQASRLAQRTEDPLLLPRPRGPDVLVRLRGLVAVPPVLADPGRAGTVEDREQVDLLAGLGERAAPSRTRRSSRSSSRSDTTALRAAGPDASPRGSAPPCPRSSTAATLRRRDRGIAARTAADRTPAAGPAARCAGPCRRHRGRRRSALGCRRAGSARVRSSERPPRRRPRSAGRAARSSARGRSRPAAGCRRSRARSRRTGVRRRSRSRRDRRSRR